MKARISITESTQKVVENVRAAAWIDLESKVSPDSSLSRWLKDLKSHSGRIPVHGPIVIREKESAGGIPNKETANESP